MASDGAERESAVTGRFGTTQTLRDINDICDLLKERAHLVDGVQDMENTISPGDVKLVSPNRTSSVGMSVNVTIPLTRDLVLGLKMAMYARIQEITGILRTNYGIKDA